MSAKYRIHTSLLFYKSKGDHTNKVIFNAFIIQKKTAWWTGWENVSTHCTFTAAMEKLRTLINQ